MIYAVEQLKASKMCFLGPVHTWQKKCVLCDHKCSALTAGVNTPNTALKKKK